MNQIIRLLYAEDNPQDADLTRTLFEREAPDFCLEIVDTGSACLAALAKKPFDLLLLDNRLPDMQGLDLLYKLREAGITLPVVLVTGVDDEENVAKALRLGAADYVSKSERDYLVRLPDILRKTMVRLQTKHQQKGAGRRIKRILYVEPHEMDVELTMQHFSAEAPHLSLQAVSTSRKALALLGQGHDFDLVLTDLRVPDMNAMELIREAQHRSIDVPFVVITGKGDEAMAVAILRLGAYDYLVKRKDYLVQLPHAIDNALQRYYLDQTTHRLNAELAELNISLEHKVEARTAEINDTKNKLQATLAERDKLLEEMRRLSQLLIHTQEEERKQLAHTLHDDIGQSLTAIKAHASSIAHNCQRQEFQRAIQSAREVQDISSAMLKTIRSQLRDLRPGFLSELGLEGALKHLCDSWEKSGAISCKLKITGEVGDLPADVQVQLFRLIQEALTNVARHAAASTASIELNLGKAGLELDIRDDGCGFDTDSTTPGMGLIGMRERALASGGQLDMQSSAGTGTHIHIRLPSVPGQAKQPGKENTE